MRACGCPGARGCACACAFSLAYPACNAYAPYCHLWPLWLHQIFRYYLINGKIFGKKLPNIKCVSWFSLQLLSKTLLVLRRIKRDTVINVKTSLTKVSVILVGFWRNLNFLDRFSGKKSSNTKFNKDPFYVSRVVSSGRTDMTKLTVAFRNFVNAPKNPRPFLSRKWGNSQICNSW
jgi:hypothetical protein